MTSNDIQKKAMIDALEKSIGIVTNACKLVGIARETHYRWMREDSAYKDLVESVGDMVLDFVESKLHTLIDGGDVASTIFYLKTKGKKRGFVERTELTGHEGQPIIHIAANL
jgi:hypothetical protein